SLPEWKDTGKAPPEFADVAEPIRVARELATRGDTEAAAERLLSAALAARRVPAYSFFALWLLEVARRWHEANRRGAVWGRLSGELGHLLAQMGAVREGVRLIQDGAEALFAGAVADRSEAWRMRYAANAWGLRVQDRVARQEAVAGLYQIRDGKG